MSLPTELTRQISDLYKTHCAPEKRSLVLNNLYGLVEQMSPWAGVSDPNVSAVSGPLTIGNSNTYNFLTLNRWLLANAETNGIVQTIIRQPVDDALRAGFSLKSKQLDADDIAVLMAKMTLPSFDTMGSKGARELMASQPYILNDLGEAPIQTLKKSWYWARLFGGGAIIINTKTHRTSALDPMSVKGDTLEFIAADRWEFSLAQTDLWNPEQPCPYHYHGLPIHRSRVKRILGQAAPSLVRQRLQGWGMSELERVIGPLNQYIKLQAVVFELIDQCKIDVLKIKGLADTLGLPDGMSQVQNMMMLTNQMKNFLNAIVIDADSDYDHKELSSVFSGIAEIWKLVEGSLAAAARIPLAKLFGQSAQGFSSGSDTTESYNIGVGTIQTDMTPLIIMMVQMFCIQEFGFAPTDLTVQWPSLRPADPVQTEEIKSKKQTRILERWDRGLITGVEAEKSLFTEGVSNEETEVGKGLRDVDPTTMPQKESEGNATEADLAKDRDRKEKSPSEGVKRKE